MDTSCQSSLNHKRCGEIRAYGAKPGQLIFKVILPAAKPAIFNDLRIVLGWAWTYIVIAEINARLVRHEATQGFGDWIEQVIVIWNPDNDRAADELRFEVLLHFINRLENPRGVGN
ncbi:ABC transporter permease subunit [Sinorhizobium meliloti]|uniref:ABC transporter permease subunit n=1 Tax=Rhizobium meliloti TaxID=382 RepID=UPI0013E3D412